MRSFIAAKMSKQKDIYLERFGQNIEHYHSLMYEAFNGVINEGVSNYPVFIFHRQEVNVGIEIADRNEVIGDWSVNISTLEEFYIKGLVTIEQVEEIKKKITGNPPQYCCLVLSEGEGSFIFLARETDEG
jgi:hypothetical protein